jgi:hypothetical protein
MPGTQVVLNLAQERSSHFRIRRCPVSAAASRQAVVVRQHTQFVAILLVPPPGNLTADSGALPAQRRVADTTAYRRDRRKDLLLQVGR